MTAIAPIALLVFFAAVIFSILITLDGNDNKQDETWEQYGDKLKKAYDAKFGYRNAEFDKDVDLRVKQAERLKFGGVIARQYLKRYARMTDCK